MVLDSGTYKVQKKDMDVYNVNNESFPNEIQSHVQNKVITTMVIRPLDEPEYFARSPFADLGIWTVLYDCSWHHTTASCVVECSHLTIVFAYFRTFGLNTKWGIFDPEVWMLSGTQEVCVYVHMPTHGFLLASH